MNNTTTTEFSFVQRIGAWWCRRQDDRLRRRCPPATVAAEQIPRTIRAAWEHHAPHEFPGLPTGGSAWLRCSLALAQFFEACRLQHAHGPCALPSKAADSVWHVWLKADPAGLADWQQRFFGRVVQHHEVQDLGAPADESLARTWAGACRSEGVSMLGPRLPLVFALDGLLRLPAGWAYGHERGSLVHRQIDGFGKPRGAVVVHTALAGAGLVALGLLTEAELRELRRSQSDSGSSSSSDSSSSSSDSSCDASGGSSDCGSSCGSSCGGGD